MSIDDLNVALEAARKTIAETISELESGKASERKLEVLIFGRADSCSKDKHGAQIDASAALSLQRAKRLLAFCILSNRIKNGAQGKIATNCAAL